MIKAAYLLGTNLPEVLPPLCAGVFLLWLGLCTVAVHYRNRRRR